MMVLEQELLPAHLKERLTSGAWKASNIGLIERALAPGRKVVEIGAGLGYCSQVIARCIFPGGVLVSFEPNPTLYQIASRRAEHLRHTIVLPVGVGVDHGHARLDGPSDEPWRCTLVPDSEGGIIMHSLADDVLTEKSHFDTLVMDAEGTEHDLLTEVDVALLGITTIVCEIHGTDKDVTRLVDSMRGLGWRMRAKTKRDPWDNVCAWWTTGKAAAK